jgi:hypothetical protein
MTIRLSETAGGEKDECRVDDHQLIGVMIENERTTTAGEAGRGIGRDDEIQRDMILEQCDGGLGSDGREQRALDLAARQVARVYDAPARVSAFAACRPEP